MAALDPERAKGNMQGAMSEKPAPPRTRGLPKKLCLALAITAAALLLALELLSRAADRVLAGRVGKEGYKAPELQRDFDFWDHLAYATLEYGSPKRFHEQSGARQRAHPYLGYALVPGYRTPQRARRQASHNALGFRGKETSVEKPSGTFRILITGGSSVYGQSESSDAAVWSQRLEDFVGEALPARRFEVLNMGAPGWSTHEAMINLALRGLDFAPDLVIVYEAINDMRCALYNKGGPVERDNTHWRAPWPIDRPSPIEKLLEKSRSYLFARRWLTDYTAARADLGFYAIKNYQPRFESDPFLHAPEPLPELGFENMRRNLVQIAALVRARGAEVVFATQALPRWHLHPARSAADQRAGFERCLAIVRDTARALAVPLCEVDGPVVAACEAEVLERIAESVAREPGRPREEIEAEWRRPGREDLLFYQEVHPNDRGSELVARTVADWLLGSGLLAR